jgi:hypothetical protein
MSIVDEPLGINENIMSLKEKTLTFPSDANEPFKDKKPYQVLRAHLSCLIMRKNES